MFTNGLYNLQGKGAVPFNPRNYSAVISLVSLLQTKQERIRYIFYRFSA